MLNLMRKYAKSVVFVQHSLALIRIVIDEPDLYQMMVETFDSMVNKSVK